MTCVTVYYITDECLGVVTNREYLEDLFDWNGFDDGKIVSYKQWVKEEKFINLTSVQTNVTAGLPQI